MSLCITDEIDRISCQVTGRSHSLFAEDLETHIPAIESRVRGQRILVAGGAGSIGSATILALLAYQPAALHIIDPNENNSVELLRHIRSSGLGSNCDIAIEPLDYGSPLCAAWLGAQEAYGLVLSFAAAKHVRSERDVWSLLRMLEINLVAADRFLAACRQHGHGQAGVFFVSTDKAANPVSLMGASKRLMELLLWAHAQPAAPTSLVTGIGSDPALARVTTTRFANVAFSDGSLPWGFLQRLAKHQALAAPSGIKRFLVSPREAGDLCLLASCACPTRHLLVPRLDPNHDAVGFDQIAEALLADRDLGVIRCDSEEEARKRMAEWAPGQPWPLLLTPADTSGEKAMEEFVAVGEEPLTSGWAAVSAISAPASVSLTAMEQCMQSLAAWTRGEQMPSAKGDIVNLLAELVPGLQHMETGRSLDGRM